MELVRVGEKTYYIKNATNIGIYKIDETQVYLIDTGNDKDAGKKILKIIDEQGWKVKGIITTHSNADHIGGNKVIQDRTNCTILAYNIEKSFTEFPILESSFLYGGIKTSDNVYFLADSLFSKETITKYHLFFIYDVREFLNTLDYLNTLEGNMYVPSHCEATDNILNLININKNKS